MLVKSRDGDIIEITKWKCSPLLVVMEETGIPVDSEDGAILLDFPTSTIHGYIEFLDGQGVDMTLELKAIIDYMCHDNKLGYPDEFWQLKKKGGHALWCDENMTIWVEPDKMSMAYIAHLYKCMKKGYSIKVPYIGLIDIDEDKTKDILVAMTMASRFSDSVWSILGPITDPMRLPRPISRIRTYPELCDNERLVTECMRRMDRRRIRYNEQVERGIPINHDLPVGEGYIEYIPYEKDLSVNFLMLIFYGICINPCSKDTSREEIEDFLEWMKSSPIAK